MWQYQQRKKFVLIHFLDSRTFWHTDYSWFNIHSPKQLAMIRNEWKQKLTLLLKYRIFVRNIKLWKITYKRIMMMVSSRYIRSICMMPMAWKNNTAYRIKIKITMLLSTDESNLYAFRAEWLSCSFHFEMSFAPHSPNSKNAPKVCQERWSNLGYLFRSGTQSGILLDQLPAFKGSGFDFS